MPEISEIKRQYQLSVKKSFLAIVIIQNNMAREIRRVRRQQLFAVYNFIVIYYKP